MPRIQTIEIGAAVTYGRLMPVISAEYPDFGELLRRLGSTQIRACGTMGGNVANGSPIGDSPPALIALAARLVLRRGEERREVALEDFFIGYGKQDRRAGEFVEKILLPRRDPNRRTLALEHDAKVSHGTVVKIQDKARLAGMNRILLLVPDKRRQDQPK